MLVIGLKTLFALHMEWSSFAVPWTVQVTRHNVSSEDGCLLRLVLGGQPCRPLIMHLALIFSLREPAGLVCVRSN